MEISGSDYRLKGVEALNYMYIDVLMRMKNSQDIHIYS